eukprot:SAG22_NODE_2738_length_2261_cov_2.822849_3_plen_124_part_00
MDGSEPYNDATALERVMEKTLVPPGTSNDEAIVLEDEDEDADLAAAAAAAGGGGELEDLEDLEDEEDEEDDDAHPGESQDTWVQCDHKNCLKWRKLPPDAPAPDEDAEWYCEMNADPRYNACR